MVNKMKERLRLSRRLWVSELNGILEKLITIIVMEKMLFEEIKEYLFGIKKLQTCYAIPWIII